jgi:hypothetical protein
MKKIMLLAALLGMIVNAAYAEEVSKKADRGGCTPCLLTCCLPLGVPAGQTRNTGFNVPLRSWGTLITPLALILHPYNAFMAYSGETAEEYLGVKDVSKPEGHDSGCISCLYSCCIPVGTPAGQLYNSGYSPGIRQILVLVIPIIELYDIFQAFNGENLDEYAGIR